MGREVKRVALDFDWLLNKVWWGYQIGYKAENEIPCPFCNGGRVTPYARPIARGEGTYTSEYCMYCGGEGAFYPRFEPPCGQGYQIWETVSEGSPVSPVMKSPESLADWMVKNDTSVTKNTTRQQWIMFIRDGGWAPSAVLDRNGVRSGVEAFADEQIKKSKLRGIKP